MTAITYTTGDATQPQGDGHRIIAHVCNDAGGWGRGFVTAISKRWRAPEDHYRALHRAGALRLGDAHLIPVEPDVTVANLIAQHGYTQPGRPAIRYGALAEALKQVAVFAGAGREVAGVHMPRIGCGLAGGTWERVEELIVLNLSLRGIPVTVYDLASEG